MNERARIDAHQHFWDPARRDYPWMEGAAMDAVRRAFEPADLEPELARAGIDGTVLVQTTSGEDETREFLEIADAWTYVHGVVGWVDLTAPDVGDRIDALAESRGGKWLVGIRHQVHDEPDPRWLCRADVRRGLRAVHERGLAYDLLLRARELAAAAETVRALPDLAFVVDHIAKPRIIDGSDPQWEAGMPALAGQDNVQVKLSGMITEADWAGWTPSDLRPFVSRVVDWFGIDRLMFGSDWPVCLLAATGYEPVVTTAQATLGDLSAHESARVFGENARTFYRLTPGAQSRPETARA